MTEPTQRQRSAQLGQRVDSIHGHSEKSRTLLPWLILGLAALAFAAWGLMRHRRAEHAVDRSPSAIRLKHFETPRTTPNTAPTPYEPATN